VILEDILNHSKTLNIQEVFNMIYKNISTFSLTFRAVTFGPGEIKEVNGYINHPKMIRVFELNESKPEEIIASETPSPKEDVANVTKVRGRKSKNNENNLEEELSNGSDNN
jgi:hypothetical protein